MRNTGFEDTWKLVAGNCSKNFRIGLCQLMEFTFPWKTQHKVSLLCLLGSSVQGTEILKHYCFMTDYSILLRLS